MIVFVYDILVYSMNKEEHVGCLETMLILLREHRLYTKLRKCNFIQSQIHYLRCFVSKEWITVDLENIKSIMEWPTLGKVDEVR